LRRLSDEGIVQELRLFIEHLEGIESQVVSDHMLNMLEELEGKLPEDKDRLLAVIDDFLALPHEERLLFQLGRRLGLLRFLSDLQDPGLRAKAEEVKEHVASQFDGDLEQGIRTLAERMI